MIWDEVGQDENERERILEELGQECQEVYRRKVNSANMSRIQLHQALAESEAEFTNLLLSLGKRSFPGRVTSNILHDTIMSKKQYEANLKLLYAA
jgi:Ase1/PRC1/MAP65 family protein